MEARRVNIPTDPGLYPSLTFDEYAAIDAVNHSFLVDMYKESPLHAHYKRATGGRDDTDALSFGRAVHLAILEPQKWDKEVMEIPKLDGRTTAGKQAWANFQRKAAGRITLEPREMSRVREVAHAILGHESGRELFKNKGVNEMTMVWIDRATQVKCKGRIDRWTTFERTPCLMDLKTCRDAGERAFQKSITDHGYGLQAAFYLMGAETLQPIPSGAAQRVFKWLAVESDGPFDIGVFQADTKMIEHGFLQMRSLLRTYKKCRETKVWPGKNGQGVITIDNPEWVYKREPIDGQIEEI